MVDSAGFRGHWSVNIEHRIVEIMAGILDIPESRIDDSLTVEDVEDWDSMRHINLVMAFEEEFGVEFNEEEILQMLSLNAIRTLIGGKLSGA